MNRMDRIRKIYPGYPKDLLRGPCPFSLRDKNRETAGRLSLVELNKVFLCLGYGAVRANIDARAAVFAQTGVDDIHIITGCDCAFRAFTFTGAAHNAIGTNYMSHDISFRSGTNKFFWLKG